MAAPTTTTTTKKASGPTEAGTTTAITHTAERVSIAVAGSYGADRIAELNDRLRDLASQCHLIAPATSVGAIPDGHAICASVLALDLTKTTDRQGKTQYRELYRVGDGFALSRAPLDRIATLAGVSFDPNGSGRTDDGSDPRYCSWKTVGAFLLFDGTPVIKVAHKQMDLRPGSAQLRSIQARHKGGNASNQVRELQMFIAEHAETKSRLRVVRALGVRSAYGEDELAKPFVVLRLMLTGDFADPDMRRLYAERRMEAAMRGAAALFGPPSTPTAVVPLTEGTSSAARLPPPVIVDDEEDGDEEADGQDQSEPGFRFGNLAGQPFASGSDRDLEWYAQKIEASIADPARARYVESNRRDLAALRAEQAKRGASARTTAAKAGGPPVDDAPMPESPDGRQTTLKT